MYPRSAVVIALTLALFGASCGSGESSVGLVDDNAVATIPEVVGATESATTTIAPGGDYDSMVEDLQVALVAWREETGAPGVSLSVRLPGEDPIDLVSGIADLDTEVPVTQDDYFRIGSITKSITSVVILQLEQEGLVELDAPVTTYLGDDWLGSHPSASEITVRQLLDHTSGLTEFAFDPGFYLEAAARQTEPYSPEDVLEFLSRQAPLFAPGEGYRYETGGSVAAGLVIEALTGNTAAEEMRTRIFEPAGVEHIYLTPQEFPPDTVVHGYSRSVLYFALRLVPGVIDNGQLINGEPVLDTLATEQAVPQSAGWTGGGLEAQLGSVAAVWKAMFDGTLMSDAMIDTMTTKTLDQNYGLGLDVGESNGTVVYSHGGGVPGFRSQAGYLPGHDIAYAFSASLIPLPEGTDVGVFRDTLIDLLVR